MDFKKHFKGQAFFSLETIRLVDPTFNRMQIARWQQKDYIQPIIRGWYRFTDIALPLP